MNIYNNNNNKAVNYLLQHPTPTEPLLGNKIDLRFFSKNNNDKAVDYLLQRNKINLSNFSRNNNDKAVDYVLQNIIIKKYQSGDNFVIN